MDDIIVVTLEDLIALGIVFVFCYVVSIVIIKMYLTYWTVR